MRDVNMHCALSEPEHRKNHSIKPTPGDRVQRKRKKKSVILRTARIYHVPSHITERIQMSSVLYRLGSGLRETGQALMRLGASMEGNFSYREQCTSRSVYACA